MRTRLRLNLRLRTSSRARFSPVRLPLVEPPATGNGDDRRCGCRRTSAGCGCGTGAWRMSFAVLASVPAAAGCDAGASGCDDIGSSTVTGLSMGKPDRKPPELAAAAAALATSSPELAGRSAPRTCIKSVGASPGDGGRDDCDVGELATAAAAAAAASRLANAPRPRLLPDEENKHVRVGAVRTGAWVKGVWG